METKVTGTCPTLTRSILMNRKQRDLSCLKIILIGTSCCSQYVSPSYKITFLKACFFWSCQYLSRSTKRVVKIFNIDESFKPTSNKLSNDAIDYKTSMLDMRVVHGLIKEKCLPKTRQSHGKGKLLTRYPTP